MGVQAVFVDRDGTLGGNGHFIHPRDFVLFPSSLAAFQLLKDHEIKIFALTNQHSISKGLTVGLTNKDVESELNRFEWNPSSKKNLKFLEFLVNLTYVQSIHI